MIRIPPPLLALPTIQAIHGEIDLKYPNRVVMNVGLVVGRYGDCLTVGNGVVVAGDGACHHDCSFRLIVFRPFVEEVLLGRILKSTEEGVQVSLGFFDNIFIPAYWMLNPSRFEKESGLWVWTPQYDEEDDDEDGNEKDKTNINEATNEKPKEEAQDPDENRFEMHLGAEIRFKVKSIHFAQVTNTAKGTQATMTTTCHMPLTTLTSSTTSGSNDFTDLKRPVRQRSSSVGIEESENLPASMHIVASICDDGLGLTSWWSSEDGEEQEE